jgi:hypothetical protein
MVGEGRHTRETLRQLVVRDNKQPELSMQALEISAWGETI